MVEPVKPEKKNNSSKAGNGLRDEILEKGLNKVNFPSNSREKTERAQKKETQFFLESFLDNIFSDYARDCYVNYTSEKRKTSLPERVKEERRKKFEQFREDFKRRIEKQFNRLGFNKGEFTTKELERKVIEEFADFIQAKNEPSFLAAMNDSLEKFSSSGLMAGLEKKEKRKMSNQEAPSLVKFWEEWEGDMDGSYYVTAEGQKVFIVDYNPKKGEVFIKKSPGSKISKISYEEFKNLLDKGYKLVSSVSELEKENANEKVVIGKIFVSEDGRVVRIGTYKPGEKQQLKNSKKSKYIRKKGTVSVSGPEELLKTLPKDEKTGGVFVDLDQVEKFIDYLQKSGFYETGSLGSEIIRLNSQLENIKKELRRKEEKLKRKSNLRIIGQFKFLVKGKNYDGDENNSGKIMVKIIKGKETKYVSFKELNEILKKNNLLNENDARKQEKEVGERKRVKKESSEKELKEFTEQEGDLGSEKKKREIYQREYEDEGKKTKRKTDEKNESKTKVEGQDEDFDEDFVIGKMSQAELDNYLKNRSRRKLVFDDEDDLVRYTTEERRLKEEQERKNLKQKIDQESENYSESIEAQQEAQSNMSKEKKVDDFLKAKSRSGGIVENYPDDFKTREELDAFLLSKARSGGEVIEEDFHEAAELEIKIQRKERELDNLFGQYKEALAEYKKARMGTTRFKRALSLLERGKEFFGVGDSWEGTIWEEKKITEAKMKKARLSLEECYWDIFNLVKDLRVIESKKQGKDKDETKKELLKIILAERVLSNPDSPDKKEKLSFFERFNLDLKRAENESGGEIFDSEKKNILKKFLERYQKLSRKQKIAFSILVSAGIGAGAGLAGGSTAAVIMMGGTRVGRKVLGMILGAGASVSVENIMKTIQSRRDQQQGKVTEKEVRKKGNLAFQEKAGNVLEKNNFLGYLRLLEEFNERTKKQLIKRRIAATGAAFVVGAGAQSFFNDVLGWGSLEQKGQAGYLREGGNDVGIGQGGEKAQSFSDIESKGQKGHSSNYSSVDGNDVGIGQGGEKAQSFSDIESKGQESYSSLEGRDAGVGIEEIKGETVLNETFKRGETVWGKLEKYYNNNQQKVAQKIIEFKKEMVDNLTSKYDIKPEQAEEYIKWRFRHIYAEKDVANPVDRVVILKTSQGDKLLVENFDHEKYLQRFMRERGVEFKEL